MNHEAMLQLYVKRTSGTKRQVLVSSDIPKGEIRVTKSEIQVSSSFISPSTDLPYLAEQCKRVEWDFDTRQERERRKNTAELKKLIRARFDRLQTINPEQADQLLRELLNGSQM